MSADITPKGRREVRVKIQKGMPILFGEVDIWANPIWGGGGGLLKTGAIFFRSRKTYAIFWIRQISELFFGVSKFKMVATFKNLIEKSFQCVIFGV